MVDTSLITQLRTKTGAGIVDCKEALTEANGDLVKAEEILRKKGLKTVAKKAGRSAKEGVITSYIHAGGKVGVLLELNCETDFVARNEEFQGLAKDLSMHIAASAPEYLKPEDVPAAVLEKEKEILRAQLKAEKKPEAMMDKIIEGKLAKFYEEHCLLKQVFIKDETKKIEGLIQEKISKTGENIEVKRFTRYMLGE
ncbi:MAG: translation elongation factor Ts [bacterium]|nr:translation elongation factor Ts [bacterium]